MEESKAKKTGGKREGQKYKSLLVWDILLKKTDENHALRLKDIEEHLSHYGITAERHSIKRDIDDILALLNKELDFDMDEFEIEERDLLGYEVEYDAAQHGYKVSRRPYDFEELRLLAECVRASKFISKSQEEHVLFISRLCKGHAAQLLPLMHDDEEYYVQMAEGWLIAELAVHEPEAVCEWLRKNDLKYNINGKAIRKICDSFRIAEDWKRGFQYLRPELRKRK